MRFAAAVLLFFLGPGPASAKTWHVFEDGSGDAPTIQAGIDSSTSGDVVLVSPGTYFEHIDFNGKDIHLVSSTGPESTIIDGSQGPGSVVTLKSGESRNAILEGFTIRGGSGSPAFPSGEYIAGGGIFCRNASPVIRGNVIRENNIGNTQFGAGGGMIVYTGDGQALNTVVIAGNHFIENESSVNGGALALSTGHHTVRDNVFVRNSCKFDGGAIWAFQPTSLTLIGNQFWENVAGDHGGAMEIGQPRTDAQCLVEGNLLVRNRAMNLDSASGNGAGGALSFRPGRGLVTRNTFVGNEGTGPLACSAGDILIWSPSGSTVEIVRNIFSKSRTCAISCMHPDGLLRGNIFWQNTPGDVWDDGGCFPGWEEDNLLVDPKFCDPLTDNFTVSKDSPALGEFGPIGAFTNPGCGEGVAVDPTSWGRIKVRYVD